MRAIWCLQVVWRTLFHRDPGWTGFMTRPLSRWKTKGGDQLVIVFRKSG
jgi:hypothetical protein